ncbi:MAG: ABC transporter permease [Planctomycetota bacterium]
MNATVGVLRRELLIFLGAPVAWVLAVVYLATLMTGFFVVGFPVGDLRLPGFWSGGYAALDALFAWIPLSLCLFVPALTMSSWAGERRLGTDELLFTHPVSIVSLVVGKFLAHWAIVVGLLGAAIVPAAIAVRSLGALDLGVVGAGFFGAVLLAASFVCVGQLASCLVADELAAFLVASLLLFALVGLGLFVRVLPPAIVEVAWYASPVVHYVETAVRGVIDVRDLVYFGTLFAAALTLEVLWLEGRRWR